MEGTLSKLYYDTKSNVSYSSIDRLFQAARKLVPGLTLRNVKDWLKTQHTYTLHKPFKRKYARSKYFVTDTDKLWQIDLADMTMISDVNDGYSYILTCVDVFSKYAWVEPVIRKTGNDVTIAFKNILRSGRKPEKLQSDMGKEFLNKTFQELLKKEDIKFYTCSNPDIKCSIIERFNRTIKSKLWKYFSKSRSYRYIDVLNDFVSGYNHSKHRSIKMTPAEASKSENHQEVYHNLYHDIRFKGKANFKRGDIVRISKAKGIFENGYLPNWSEEVFRIRKPVNSSPPKYFLEDLMAEPVKGGFYEQELQGVPEPSSYWIEKVIKTRITRGKRQYFVKWLGYPEKFNSWVSDGFLPLSS